ncbi:MAG: Hsp70 family protein, partial [Clostridia bacterium]|nr:Hsp70 family protein [Clostridia bacterium]
EKTLSDLGDKVDEADKAPVRDAIEKLKNTVKSDDLDAIKADTEALEKAFYPIAEKMYAAQGGAQADPNMGGAGMGQDGNTYYSADFEDKSDN